MGFRYLLSIGVLLVHVYLWRRLVADTHLPRAAKAAATLVLLLLWLSIPATFFYFRRAAGGDLLTFVAFTWLGLMFYAFLLLLSFDLARMLHAITRKLRRTRKRLTTEELTAQAMRLAGSEQAEHTRRVFVARAAATSALVATSGIGAIGVRSALWDITTPEVTVQLARLPRALDGYSIALLSDVHIGVTLDGRFLRELVERTNRLKPDLIAITGDLVDGSVAQLGAQVAELSRLRARQGVCFVTGNHEYYSGADAWIAFLQKLGVRVLMNERLALGDASPRGAQFDLAGIPDHRAGGRHPIAPDAELATLGRDPERELVMLAHQPIQVADAAAVGAGLQLSGHTHGGQLYPFGALTLLAQPYLAGLYRHEATHTQVYVSRGAGFWGPPMRVLAPAEIARIRLVSG